MRKTKLLLIGLTFLCLTGILQLAGPVKAMAAAIPDNACKETTYQPYENPSSDCGKTGHTFVAYNTKPVDCTQAYYQRFDCQNPYCYSYYFIKRKYDSHIWVNGYRVEPGCSSTGSQQKVCKRCDSTKYITLAKLAHNWAFNYKNDATCYSEGYKYYYCTSCYTGKSVVIPQKKHKYVKKVEKVGVGGYSGCSYKRCTRCGNEINYKSWYAPSSIKLSYDKCTSNGKYRRPKVTVRDIENKKINKKYYTVKYSNNKKPGKATVKVIFKTRYKGSMKTNFTITPKRLSTFSASYKSSAKIKVKWSKQSGVDGYVVQYSTKSSFPDGGETCTKFVKKSQRSLTLDHLNKTRYYVRVAGYVKIGNTIHAGKYTKKKSVYCSSGTSVDSMIASLKSTTKYRDRIMELTDKGVDIKKYGSTLSRFKALYTWHAKHSGGFVHCLACNANFVQCVYLLIDDKQYDHWLWISCDTYRNNSGSTVMHKWATIFLQGVPYQFDPRMQGNLGNPSGFSNYGFTYGSSVGKHYIFDDFFMRW